MAIKRTSTCFLLVLLSVVMPRLSSAQDSSLATLEITIQENGAPVHHEYVYVFSRNKQQFFGTHKVKGIAKLQLPPGDYRVYAAAMTSVNGLIDHYSTPEAFVHMSHEEPSFAILSLQKSTNEVLHLSDTARQKLGIDEELGKYLN